MNDDANKVDAGIGQLPRLVGPFVIRLHNRRVIVGPDPAGGDEIGILWKRLEGREVKRKFVKLSQEAAEATVCLLLEVLKSRPTAGIIRVPGQPNVKGHTPAE